MCRIVLSLLSPKKRRSNSDWSECFSSVLVWRSRDFCVSGRTLWNSLNHSPEITWAVVTAVRTLLPQPRSPVIVYKTVYYSCLRRTFSITDRICRCEKPTPPSKQVLNGSLERQRCACNARDRGVAGTGAQGHRDHLQHIVAHCKTLHHPAAHWNTLQQTLTHCNTLQHTATQGRGDLWHTVRRPEMHRNTLQHAATHFNAQ